MSLDGKIDVFGAADIIQLIAQQQKTGSLKFQKGEEQVEILFEKGEIFGTFSQSRMYGDPLGVMLMRAGSITSKNLSKALKIQQKTFEYLGHILIQQGLVEVEQIQRALYTQVYETFYNVLQWKDGAYSFEQKEIVRATMLPDLPPVESIMLDALRMIDEWPEIESFFPQNNIIVSATDMKCSDNLSSDESIIYSLVDGKRTIEQIADQSLLGMFAAYKILSEMVKDGLIEIEVYSSTVDKKNISDLSDKKYLKAGLFFRRNINYIYCALLLFFLFLLFFLLPTSFPSRVIPFLDSENRGRILLEDYFTAMEHRRTETKAQIHELRYGKIEQ